MSEAANEFTASFWSVIPWPVLHSQVLSDKTKLIYGVIASLVQARDEDGEVRGYCFASNAYLASVMGCGERTITRSIAELVDAGELIVQHVGVCDKKGNRMRRIYTLETYARGIVKTGETANFGDTSIDKNCETVINRFDNKSHDIPPIPPTEKTESENTEKRFEDFWTWYRTVYCADDHNRAGNKAKAKKAWVALKPNRQLIDRMGAYLLQQSRTEMHQRGFGIAYASTFLNAVRKKEIDLTPEPDVPQRPPDGPKQEAWGWGQ